jgi:hypothetical protein
VSSEQTPECRQVVSGRARHMTALVPFAGAGRTTTFTVGGLEHSVSSKESNSSERTLSKIANAGSDAGV